MNNFEIEGKIIKVLEPQTVGQKGTRKREFWLETQDGAYTQTIKFETLTPALVDGLTQAHVGATRVVHFNLRGRLYDGRNGQDCFNSLLAWKVNRAAGTDQPVPPPPPVKQPEPEIDDLPF